MSEIDNTFAGIAKIIADARDNAYRKINEELNIFKHSFPALKASTAEGCTE